MSDYDRFNKILLIDDEETCIICMKILLKDFNYKLSVAINGKNALEILNSERIDLILLDLMLPDIHGLDLLKLIKNNKKLSNIPVILQTGSADWKDIKIAKENGIVSFIRKPYQKDVLIKNIDKFMLSQIEQKISQEEYYKM